MFPLPKSIRPLLLAALGCTLSASTAVAQNLQWQHASNTRATSAPTTPTASPAAVEYSAARTTSPATAKRPTSNIPAPLPDMAGARPVAAHQADNVYRGPGYDKPNVAPAVSLQQPADGPRTFAPPTKLARAVKQSQWEEIAAPQGVPHHQEVVDQGPYDGYPDASFGAGVMGWGDPSCGCEPGCACEPSCEYVEPGCACGDVGCGDCCDTCETRPRGCVPIYIYVPPINEFNAFVGVQGFKSPFDSAGDRGNFGFHEGFNLGGEMSWIAWPGLAYQVGFRATQNRLNDDGSHSQQFLTTGLFRRAKQGLQYGVVYDLMHDERQGGNDFDQVRGEISYATGYARDFGFLFAAQTNARMDGNTSFQASDQFLLFYRMYGRQGGELRLFAGFDDDSNGIFGSDFSVPLNNRWTLDGGWTYLHGDNVDDGAAANEGWNIGMALVWHWGCRAKVSNRSPYRPLFNVADNGSMIIVDR
jgi:hypothetical protein